VKKISSSSSPELKSHSPGYKAFIKQLEYLENGEEPALPSSPLLASDGQDKPAQAKVIEPSNSNEDSISRENDGTPLE
jgi:hypothetical protein